jgi:hypothetical protein
MIDYLSERFGETVLLAHSLWRWVVAIVMCVWPIRSLVSLVGGDDLNGADRTMGLVTVLVLDLQMLIGICLLTMRFHEIPAAARNPLRLYEHPTMMLVVIVCAHVAHVMVKKQKRVPGMVLWLVTALLFAASLWRIMSPA